jgi:hypothetical protein
VGGVGHGKSVGLPAILPQSGHVGVPEREYQSINPSIHQSIHRFEPIPKASTGKIQEYPLRQRAKSSSAIE